MSGNDNKNGVDPDFLEAMSSGHKFKTRAEREREREAEPPTPLVNAPVPKTAAEVPVEQPRRSYRRRGGDYRGRFLNPVELEGHKLVKVSVGTHRRLMKVVSSLGDGETSLQSYIESILTDHLDTYRDEISRLRREENEKEI